MILRSALKVPEGGPLASLQRWFTAKRVLAVTAAVAIFGYLGVRGYQGVYDLVRSGVTVDYRYLLISTGVWLAGTMLAAAVWGFMLRQLNVAPGFFFNLQVYAVSSLARKLPGTIWYAVSRVALYHQRGYARTPVIAALVMEVVALAMAGCIALLLGLGLGAGAVPWLSRIPGLGRQEVLWLVPVAVLALIWVQPAVVKWFSDRQHRVQNGGSPQPATLPASQYRIYGLVWMAGSTVVVAAAAAVLYFLLLALDIHVPWAILLAAFGLSVALGPIGMWLPADIGLREGVLYVALTPFLSPSIAAVAVLLMRLWVTLLEIGFGAICLATLTNSWLRRRGHGQPVVSASDTFVYPRNGNGESRP